MLPIRTRLLATVVAPLLVVGLAACAQVEPEALPTPTPAPTETVAAPTLPTSRVPATCDELFTSDLVSGGSAVTEADPVSRQAGYLLCTYEGTIGAAAARLSIDIAVDPPSGALTGAIEVYEGLPGVTIGVAGEESYLSCFDDYSYCAAEFVSGSYAAGLVVNQGAAGDEASLSIQSFLRELAARVASWPSPEPAWQAPVESLRWSGDCEGEVREAQDVVRSAVPFPLQNAESGLGPDATSAYYWSRDATGYTLCEWFGDLSTVSVQILPGGAWMFEAGVPLAGEPYQLDGALAAAVDTQYGNYQLGAYIDGSFVVVTVSPPFESGIDPDPIAVAVIEALVAAF